MLPGRSLQDADGIDRTGEMVGPQNFTIPAAELSLSEGGRYRFRMAPPDGEPFHLSGEFLEIDPPWRLVYTFLWEEPTPDDRETVVDLSLGSTGEATRLVLSQGPFLTDERLNCTAAAGPSRSRNCRRY